MEVYEPYEVTDRWQLVVEALLCVAVLFAVIGTVLYFYQWYSPREGGLEWQKRGYEEAVRQITEPKLLTVDGFEKWATSDMCEAKDSINETKLPLAWQAEKDGEEFGNYQAGYLRVCDAVNKEIEELKPFHQPDTQKVPEIMKVIKEQKDWYGSPLLSF